jgi:putative membrane protein
MKKIVVATLLAAASSAAWAGLPTSDQDFVTNAAQGGMAEVALGKLATHQGASAAVKKFGQQMTSDHSKANAELATAAKKAGATVPAAPSDKQNETLTEMKGMKGAAFDKAYADAMVKDHEETIALFEKESSKADEGPVKTFASKTLPTLEHHLKMAKDLQQQVK